MRRPPTQLVLTARVRSLLAAAAVAACAPACAPAPSPAPAPAAVPPASAGQASAAADSLRSVQVPAFRGGPLVSWGASPAGEPHAERQRIYDLQHQVVRVRFDWARRAVVGSTTLRVGGLPGAAALAQVQLDAVEMQIGGVRGARGEALPHEYDGRTLAITLPTPLRAGAAVTVTVDYEAVRPRKGAYFIDRRHVVWTQGEMEDTRYWVPTYDAMNDKTTWEFYIRAPKGEKALSNGRLAGTRPVGGDVEWHWVLDRPASTYLMTAVTGDYIVLEDRWRTVPVGYWTYADSVQAAWRGFGKTPRMVEVFSAKTGTPYPWAKYDQVVAPDYIFGGMENVTATTQADDRVLHPAWAEPQANADALVAHELGHQWYGDLLTARAWSHVWLNEGFATFLEAVFVEAERGRDDGAMTRLEAQEKALAADLTARRPMVFDRWATDPLELFDAHVYERGASVLQMLRRQLGDALFWKGMRLYTTRHAFASVLSDDFRRAMEEAAGRDLSAFFRQWVYGAGFPAFQVALRYDDAAKSVVLDARQTQPRDSLTGLFEVDVDVEVLTDSGAVRAVVPMRGERATATIRVPAPPRSVRWDKGGWLLDVADFPRSTAMLAHQLAHDDDVLGRIEAAELLSERAGDRLAAIAVAKAAGEDAFWGVRTRAAGALARLAGDSTASRALLAASRDADARVRQAAAMSLRNFPGPDVAGRLRELASADSSLYVRGAALGSYAALEKEAALPAITAALGRDSWLDLERTKAVAALEPVGAGEGWATALRFLAPGTSRETRQAAVRTLLAFAMADTARAVALVPALAPLLDADDLFVRQTAANALGQLGQAASGPALAALAARRKVEAESRVINEIDAAVDAIRRRIGGT